MPAELHSTEQILTETSRLVSLSGRPSAVLLKKKQKQKTIKQTNKKLLINSTGSWSTTRLETIVAMKKEEYPGSHLTLLHVLL